MLQLYIKFYKCQQFVLIFTKYFPSRLAVNYLLIFYIIYFNIKGYIQKKTKYIEKNIDGIWFLCYSIAIQ